MSKTLNPDMVTAIADATTYLVRIWQLELTTGAVYRFTDTNADLVVGGETFKYDPGITVSSVEATLNSSGDNAQIEVATSPEFLSKLQIRQGLMDGATFELWYVDWRNPDLYGKIEVFAGSVVDVDFHDKGKAKIQLNSDVSGNAPQMIGARYSRLCRAVLGDENCKVDLDALRLEVLITTVTDAGYAFTSNQLIGENYDGYFAFGRVEFITGENTGFTYELKNNTSADGKVLLNNTPRAPLNSGDAVWLWPGCDKQLGTCRDKFNNLLNHRAEPYALPTGVYVIQGKVSAEAQQRTTYAPLGGGGNF